MCRIEERTAHKDVRPSSRHRPRGGSGSADKIHRQRRNLPPSAAGAHRSDRLGDADRWRLCDGASRLPGALPGKPPGGRAAPPLSATRPPRNAGWVCRWWARLPAFGVGPPRIAGWVCRWWARLPAFVSPARACASGSSARRGGASRAALRARPRSRTATGARRGRGVVPGWILRSSRPVWPGSELWPTRRDRVRTEVLCTLVTRALQREVPIGVLLTAGRLEGAGRCREVTRWMRWLPRVPCARRRSRRRMPSVGGAATAGRRLGEPPRPCQPARALRVAPRWTTSTLSAVHADRRPRAAVRYLRPLRERTRYRRRRRRRRRCSGALSPRGRASTSRERGPLAR